MGIVLSCYDIQRMCFRIKSGKIFVIFYWVIQFQNVTQYGGVLVVCIPIICNDFDFVVVIIMIKTYTHTHIIFRIIFILLLYFLLQNIIRFYDFLNRKIPLFPKKNKKRKETYKGNYDEMEENRSQNTSNTKENWNWSIN